MARVEAGLAHRVPRARDLFEEARSTILAFACRRSVTAVQVLPGRAHCALLAQSGGVFVSAKATLGTVVALALIGILAPRAPI